MGCKKCGMCCRWGYFRFNTAVELTTLLRLRGAELVGDKMIRVPMVCRLLDQETNLCKDYENRPQECKDFPEKGVKPEECKYEEDVL